MTHNLKIVRLKGRDIIPYIQTLAQLRMDIFKDYPYLYDGSPSYENNYLNTYVTCSESIIVLALDKDKVVGASSAIPLEFETIEFQQPFLENHLSVKKVFYFGESVLRPEYRGQGLYRYFFAEREAAAMEYGSKLAAFASVERPLNDKKRPKDYKTLDPVWRHFGYEKHPELCMYFEWKEIDEILPTPKPLIFWLKKL